MSDHQEVEVVDESRGVKMGSQPGAEYRCTDAFIRKVVVAAPRQISVGEAQFASG